MRNLLSLAAKGVVALVLVVFVALLILQWKGGEWLRQPLERASERYTGRTLSIRGDLNLKVLTWRPGFEAWGIAYGNPEWAGSKPFFEARRALLRIDLKGLFKRRIDVTDIELDRAALRLVQGADGTGNWALEFEHGKAKPEREPKGPVMLPRLRRVHLVDTSVAYTNQATGKTFSFRADDLLARLSPQSDGGGSGVDFDADLTRAYGPNPDPRRPLVQGIKLAARQRHQSLAVRVDLDDLSLDEVSRSYLRNVDFGRVKGEDLIAGRLALTSSFKTHWQGELTKQRALEHLDGELGLAIEDGKVHAVIMELLGLDLTEAVGSYFAKNPKVPMQCLLARVPVKDGKATLDPLVVETSDSNIYGNGTLHLNDQSLDLTFEVAPKDFSIGAARTPLHLRGTLRKPKVSVDPRPLAGRALAAVGLGVALGPAAALVPFIETGLSKDGACAKYAASLRTIQSRSRAATH